MLEWTGRIKNSYERKEQSQPNHGGYPPRRQAKSYDDNNSAEKKVHADNVQPADPVGQNPDEHRAEKTAKVERKRSGGDVGLRKRLGLGGGNFTGGHLVVGQIPRYDRAE